MSVFGKYHEKKPCKRPIPFSASPQKIRVKTYGRSPDLQRPDIRSSHICPFPSHKNTVKRCGRSYGCGGSGAIRQNRFLSSLLNPFRRKDTVRRIRLCFHYITLFQKVKRLEKQKRRERRFAVYEVISQSPYNSFESCFLVLVESQLQETDPGPTCDPITGPIMVTKGFTPVFSSMSFASSSAPV